MDLDIRIEHIYVRIIIIMHTMIMLNLMVEFYC